MKKYSSIIISLIFSGGVLLAQESIMPGRVAIISPEVGAGTSATFRLCAPKASDVLLQGNVLRSVFITDSIGARRRVNQLPLVEKDGVWSITIDSLRPDLYTYKFIVDGVETLDPLNAHVVRDVNNVSNLLYIASPETDNYMQHNVPHGSLHTDWYTSSFNSLERRLSVYTPAGYDKDNRNYPVLYLLHGMGGDETSWRDLGRAVEILDNMIAAGEVKPMIVVMPNGNLAREAAPGHDAYGLAQPDFYLPHTADGEFESHFADIIKHIESKYRVLTDKNSRAIAGLSMGGMHSLFISANNPDLFSAVGLFSAAVKPIGYDNKELPEVYKDEYDKVERQLKDNVPLYYIAIGTDDFLFEDNRAFRAKLDNAKLHYIYNETDGGHEWSNWRHYLMDFLPRLFK